MQEPLQPKPIEPITDADDPRNACGANALQHLIGQNASKLDTMKFSGRIRIIKPGMAVTKDYRLDRLNFDIDENDLIKRISCG